MQGIQQVLISSEPEHVLCNGSAAATPAVSSNGPYSTAHAGGAQQRSRPDASSNGCSQAVLANGHTLKEQHPFPSSAQVIRQLTSTTHLERGVERKSYGVVARIFRLTQLGNRPAQLSLTHPSDACRHCQSQRSPQLIIEAQSPSGCIAPDPHMCGTCKPARMRCMRVTAMSYASPQPCPATDLYRIHCTCTPLSGSTAPLPMLHSFPLERAVLR